MYGILYGDRKGRIGKLILPWGRRESEKERVREGGGKEQRHEVTEAGRYWGGETASRGKEGGNEREKD